MPSSPDAGAIPDAILDRQRASWLAGARLSVEELLRGTPHEHDPEAQLDLVYHEIVVQEELGFPISTDDYLCRYPHLRQDLELHFEVHRALEDVLTDTARPNGEYSWPESHGRHGARPSDELADDAPPNYQLVRELGRGAMAVVYEARHRSLGRHVALKRFERGRRFAPREFFRIRKEAEAMARLAHPNIIQIYEIEEFDGSPCLALELAERGTLAQKLQQFPFTPAAAAELIETLARAIHHAHGRQIIHRDLKPANVLFAMDGTPKITDFGLAKVLEERDVATADATRTGEAMGTPRYMSPEQADGRNNDVGPATDVYALGTLLYECLTGRAPFVSASVMETLQKIRSDDPLRPRKLQPGIPGDLETICLRCLEKEPARRFTTAVDLANDLARFRRGEPIRSRPTPVWERAWKWCRRRPAHAALLAMILLLSTGGISGAMVTQHLEKGRIAALREEISLLMRDGRTALERDDVEVAQEKFRAAWLKVQAEQELNDHMTGVAGWLDHTRNAANKAQWKERVPPREFDERRDEALVESLLAIPYRQHSAATAREAIRQALEFTIPGDPVWQSEREQLALLDADVILATSGPAAAWEAIEAADIPKSRASLMQRAELLAQLGRGAEAAMAQRDAQALPPARIREQLRAGMTRLRQGDFGSALRDFEETLNREPENFAARLFEALCFLRLDRPGEARVALTACIAQRPRFHWNYYYRAQTALKLGDLASAERDLRRATEARPPSPVHYAALIDLGLLSIQSGNSDSAREFFAKAAELVPDEPTAVAGLTTSVLLSEGTAIAVEILDRVLKLHPALQSACGMWRKPSEQGRPRNPHGK